MLMNILVEAIDNALLNIKIVGSFPPVAIHYQY